MEVSALKSVVAVLLVLVMVAGVAITGSSAQPMTGATGPGFNDLATATEAAGDADPQLLPALVKALKWAAREAAKAAVAYAVYRALERAFGAGINGPADLTHVNEAIFDPAP
jgi:hypothetical protein